MSFNRFLRRRRRMAAAAAYARRMAAERKRTTSERPEPLRIYADYYGNYIKWRVQCTALQLKWRAQQLKWRAQQLIYFIHSSWASLLKAPSFMLEFTTPIIRALYQPLRASLGNDANDWKINYYEGLGASTSQVAVADDEETVTVEGARYGGDYEYLLSLPIVTWATESVHKLLAEKAKEFEILKATSPKSMWMKDLEELEKKLNEIDSKEAEEERKRSSQANRKIAYTTAANKPPQPQKYNKKAKNVEQENDNSSMETGDPVQTTKSKIGRPKKASLKKVDDDEVLSLEECLAAYNFGASSDKSRVSAAMEAEEPQVPAGKKENSKRGGAEKKSSSTIVLDSSDCDNENDVNNDDEDFELLGQASLEARKKKGGRKPAAQNAKPPLATKKKNVRNKQSQILIQKLMTDMLQPAEGSGMSPEKKVRKMRASPFNKKSISVLGRVAKKDEMRLQGKTCQVCFLLIY